jgi:hypothetical protein
MARERRVSGTRAEGFPPRRRARWDFRRVADGELYLLRKGRDFDVEVDSLAIAARRWAREHGYTLTTRSEFDERQEGRPKVGAVRSVRGERCPPTAAGRRLDATPLTQARRVD